MRNLFPCKGERNAQTVTHSHFYHIIENKIYFLNIIIAKR